MNYPFTFKAKKYRNESDLLDFIREQLVVHSRFHVFVHEFKWTLKKSKNHRCASVDFSGTHKSRLLTENDDVYAKPNLPICILTKNPELCSITEIVFMKLVVQYSGTTWIKEDKRPLLHIAAIKQLWFDCYTGDYSFYKMLIDSLPSKLWISIESFYKSIEIAQKGSVHNIFSLKRYEKKSKKKLLIQKLLFFFSLIQVEVGPLITKENLFRVFYIANKREITLIQMLVDLYFKIADDRRGNHKDYICFSEFFNAALKSIDGK